jgi:transposase
MAPVSYFNKVKIITMLERGFSEVRIADQLGLVRSSVNFISRKWRETGSLDRKVGSRRPRAPTEQNDRALIEEIENNPFTTAVEARNLTNFPASVHTARRRIRETRLKNFSAATKIRLTPRHKEARLAFALEYMLRGNDFWENVIFSDKKVFQSASNGRMRVYRPRNQRYNPKYVHKNDNSGRFSVNMWAWVSAKSPGVIVHIEERLTSHIYTRILEEIMVPSVRVVYPEDNFVFQQDNCPVHTAHRVSEWFQNHGINVLDWPSLSPDLNPIENMWAAVVKSMKRRRVRFENKDQFLTAISEAWHDLPRHYFTNLCLSMPNRLLKVYEANGKMTKY